MSRKIVTETLICTRLTRPPLQTFLFVDLSKCKYFMGEERFRIDVSFPCRVLSQHEIGKSVLSSLCYDFARFKGLETQIVGA